jgi:UDP-N-acetylmuramyl pentapeptide synthase
MLELGSAEAEGHRQVGEAAARVVDALFTIGSRGPMIAEAARVAGASYVRHFDSKEEAAAFFKHSLDAGDVLLVKASHSLDLAAIVRELLT